MDTKYCPHCNEEITSLDYKAFITQYGAEYGSANLDGEIIEEHSTDIDECNTDEIEFYCPNCNGEVTTEELLDEQKESIDELVEEETELSDEEKIKRINLLELDKKNNKQYV